MQINESPISNFRIIVLRGFQVIERVINCTLHLFKDQPEDGPTVGPKHIAGIII